MSLHFHLIQFPGNTERAAAGLALANAANDALLRLNILDVGSPVTDCAKAATDFENRGMFEKARFYLLLYDLARELFVKYAHGHVALTSFRGQKQLCRAFYANSQFNERTNIVYVVSAGLSRRRRGLRRNESFAAHSQHGTPKLSARPRCRHSACAR